MFDKYATSSKHISFIPRGFQSSLDRVSYDRLSYDWQSIAWFEIFLLRNILMQCRLLVLTEGEFVWGVPSVLPGVGRGGGV